MENTLPSHHDWEVNFKIISKEKLQSYEGGRLGLEYCLTKEYFTCASVRNRNGVDSSNLNNFINNNDVGWYGSVLTIGLKGYKT